MIRRWMIIFGGLVMVAVIAACQQPRVVKYINPSPVTTMDLERVRWCDDELGASQVYPCKWDSNIRPVTSWAPGQPKIAIWVRRAIGCPIPLPEGTTCFWAPVDQ